MASSLMIMAAHADAERVEHCRFPKNLRIPYEVNNPGAEHHASDDHWCTYQTDYVASVYRWDSVTDFLGWGEGEQVEVALYRLP